jgi:Tol biopolymer transport system component
MRSALALLALVVLAYASPAWATFSGRNGLLAFGVYSLNEESTDILYDEEFIGIAHVPGGPRHIFSFGSQPSFSPDGRWLAYTETDYFRGPGIWLTRPDCRWPESRSEPAPCSRLRRLTRRMDDSPAWTPGGKRVSFVRGDRSIYTVRANGGGLRFLVRGHAPDWSSTGALAFVGRRGTIHVREPGGRVRTLPVSGGTPTWAPRGNRLAFVGTVPAARSPALYTINADGSRLRQVWQSPTPKEEFTGPLSPAWSPDGRWIAFVKQAGVAWTGPVHAIRPNGRGLRALTPGLPECRRCLENLNFSSIDWQPKRQ